jgi:hypothetical protein
LKKLDFAVATVARYSAQPGCPKAMPTDPACHLAPKQANRSSLTEASEWPLRNRETELLREV